MLLPSLALMVGEALYQRHRAPASAEQHHGNWELTSQTQESSLKSLFNEVCECTFFKCFLALAVMPADVDMEVQV